MNTKDLNIENLVRSGVVLAVGLPVALSLGGLSGAVTRALETGVSNAANPTASATNVLKERLAAPCLSYMLSKDDSKLERQAKEDIDEVMGGQVSYLDTCKWVL